jgi:hypothetical protein
MHIGPALYFPTVGGECVVCKASDQERRVNKCPICFKLVCESCSHRTMGRDFCSKRCADQFFFGDDDD